MKYAITLLIGLTLATTGMETLFDFDKSTKTNSWQVVDDGVMGGKSQGKFSMSPEGHGIFEGHVSLENNGGFSSVQHEFKERDATAFTHFTIRLKGDGKDYQFRVKNNQRERHSYITTFPTTGAWETVTIPFEDMTPQFHGEPLDLPHYSGKTMAQVTVLAGNGKEENFHLALDKISLE